MKKKIPFFFFCCISISIIAQNSGKSGRDFVGVAARYSTEILQKSYFGNQLNSFKNLQINSPVSSVGLALLLNGKYGVGNSRNYTQEIIFNKVLNSRLAINDSTNGTLSGFKAGICVFGKRIYLIKKRFYFNYGLGFNAGRMKWTLSKNNRQVNPFFCPKLALKPMLKLGSFYLACTVEYEYDLSNPSWKYSKKSLEDQTKLNRFSQTGVMISLNLGLYIL